MTDHEKEMIQFKNDATLDNEIFNLIDENDYLTNKKEQLHNKLDAIENSKLTIKNNKVVNKTDNIELEKSL